jgi:hypothetical protein
MSICDDLHEPVDRWLGTTGVGTRSPHYRDKSACLLVSGCSTIAPAPVARLFDAVLNKWVDNDKPNIVERALGSTKNWRFEPCTKIDPNNKSREKRLEKDFTREKPPDWANQVPVASGVASPYSDRKTSLDLVRRVRKDHEYVFYELKIKSDNPLYAAIEILRNGIIYLAARRRVMDQAPADQYLITKNKELLKATRVHLAVLAPENFYRSDKRYKLDVLAGAINEGLKSFLVDQALGLEAMDFAFEALPADWASQNIIRLQSAIADRDTFQWGPLARGV